MGKTSTASLDHPAASGCIVELRAARIPVIGVIAHHHWLVVHHDAQHRDRWEVWQYPGFGGERSYGHLHVNLLAPEAGVGSGASWAIDRWCGESAVALRDRIERSPDTYPWCFEYHYWPGPNSNTYVQWILGGRRRLGRCGIGRRYCRRAGLVAAEAEDEGAGAGADHSRRTGSTTTY